MDDIRIDSHKLIYHPDRVARWFNGENIYPIEIEISPSGACNHRCVFCAVDYIGYQANFLDKDTILRDVRDIAPKGLKSVVCSGEGEPLLNKNLPDIVNGINACGVDVAMNTNGVLLTRGKLEACLNSFTWVRYSVAAFDETLYDQIQRGKPGDLARVKDNLAAAVEIKRKNGLRTTLGVQCLLMPVSAEQVVNMARELREIGVDYFTVKPYSQNLHSKNRQTIDYGRLRGLEDELKAYAAAEFKVYFRANAIDNVHHKKSYSKCLGLPFMTHIDAKGNVWPCVAHIGASEFCYGNIYEQTFLEIWEGARRRVGMEKLYAQDINKICREACRLDEMNKYLNELKHPNGHVNFI